MLTYLTQNPGYYNLSIYYTNGTGADEATYPVYKSSKRNLNQAVRSVPVRVTPTFISAVESKLDLSSMGEVSVSRTAMGVFGIQPQDRFGNNVTEADLDGWSMVIATGSGSLFDFTREEKNARLSILSYPPDFEIEAWAAVNPSRLEVNKYFEVEYDVGLTAGVFQGMVTFRGAQIRGSPFQFIIKPGPIGASDVTGAALRRHPHRCQLGYNRCTYIDGLALKEGVRYDITDQTTRAFTIYPRDIYGNTISDPTGIKGLENAEACKDTSDPNCPFRVILMHPFSSVNYTSLKGWSGGQESEQIEVVLQDDGTFKVDLKFMVNGDYRIIVSLHTVEDGNFLEPVPTFGLPVGFSPSTCLVVQGTAAAFNPADPGVSYAYGDGLAGGMSSIQASFSVQAVKTVCVLEGVVTDVPPDRECPGRIENKAAPRGGEIFTATLTELLPGDERGAVTQATVADLDDGTYDIFYTLQKSGEFLLSVFLGGEPIMGFTARPQTIRIVPGDTSPDTSTIEGVPSTGVLFVGVRAVFTIVARDRFGNPQEPKESQLLPDVFEVDIQLMPQDPENPGVDVPPLTVDQVCALVCVVLDRELLLVSD